MEKCLRCGKKVKRTTLGFCDKCNDIRFRELEYIEKKARKFGGVF